jgi:hypothetical protein
METKIFGYPNALFTVRKVLCLGTDQGKSQSEPQKQREKTGHQSFLSKE